MLFLLPPAYKCNEISNTARFAVLIHSSRPVNLSGDFVAYGSILQVDKGIAGGMILSRIKLTRMAGLALLGFALCVTGAQIRQERLTESGGGYLLREEYPPLLYVPESQTGPEIYAASAVVLEAANGTILYAHNEHVRRAPASTTKIMTGLVALLLGDARSLVEVGSWASWTPGSSIGLRKGDQISLGELLQGLMLRSGNDAGVAIAEHISGTENGFVSQMNRLCRQFGALNTHFRNPHGLPAAGHYTTAYDLALITRYALQNKEFARLVRTRDEELEWAGEHQTEPISNTNRLLWSFPGADGVKTGTTSEAGPCLVASATRGGRQLIVVVLKSADRWHDASALLEYGFKSFRVMRLADETENIAYTRIVNGSVPGLRIQPRRELAVVCRRGCEILIRLKTEWQKSVQAPVRAGQILGRLTALYDGEEIDGVDLIAKRRVEKKTRWRLWQGI